MWTESVEYLWMWFICLHLWILWQTCTSQSLVQSAAGEQITPEHWVLMQCILYEPLFSITRGRWAPKIIQSLLQQPFVSMRNQLLMHRNFYFYKNISLFLFSSLHATFSNKVEPCVKWKRNSLNQHIKPMKWLCSFWAQRTQKGCSRGHERLENTCNT